ncbi:hypothetical protein ASE66_12370 [Bosea sp. Root483D1]|uniref:DUF4167 domain-containing protein n=1 Tax=Bosea sp. Root483D1 TaxID=1736544 RepID=UPI000710250A|nr:DUF4167 domain-containing protein [Bosea sp. Root483D1]KRE15635.1 hypothetical protein ASE66_12370 [Bosea sp. Root483D1]
MTTHQPRPTAFDNRFPRSGPRDDVQTRRGSTAQASYERYLALAKAKALAGDSIEAERYYQYAEHYHRLINGSAA